MSEEAASVLNAWDWEPSIILGFALLVGIYLLCLGPWRSRFQDSQPVGRGRVISFLFGAFVLFVALVSPLDEIGDKYLFSAHMTQHLLLTLAGPPFLLLGTPQWMLRPLLRYRPIAAIARVLTNPLIAFALFNFDFAVWHLPLLYESTLENETIHIIEHLLFMSTAVLNWWPILSPLTELPRLPYPAQILYLFLDAVPSTVLGAIFVFAPNALYPTYAVAPRIFGFSAIEDQLMGGLIMAMPGGMAYLVALSIVFFIWLSREDRAEETKAVSGVPRQVT